MEFFCPKIRGLKRFFKSQQMGVYFGKSKVYSYIDSKLFEVEQNVFLWKNLDGWLQPELLGGHL